MVTTTKTQVSTRPDSLPNSGWPSPAARPTRTGVLFVTTATRPPLGADVSVHAEIMKNLDRQGFEVHTACAPGPAGAPTPTFDLLRAIPDLRIHRVNFGTELKGPSARHKLQHLLSAVGAIGSLAKLARLIRRHHISIVHTTDRPRDAFAGIVLSRLTGARALVHLHVAYADWMSPLRKWSIRKAAVLVSVSDFVESTLASSGHDPNRLHTVLNGIDIDRWEGRLPADDIREVRHELGIPEQAPVIITVCRLFPAKGPAELIKSLRELVGDTPDVRLLVVGQEMQPGYADELQRLAAESGVGANVIFAGWRADVQRLMGAADIFAMPSIGEPCALVYLEAMAMALPVVALESGGTPELVDDGHTGLLSKPGDLEGLTSNLRTLLASRELRTAMGARGRQRVEQHFTAEKMARNIERIYKRHERTEHDH